LEYKERLRKLLMRIQALEGVEGCLAATRNGNLLENVMPQDVDANRLSAMAASMLGAAEVAAETVRRGLVRHLTVNVEGGKMVIVGVGPKAILLFLVKNDPAVVLRELGEIGKLIVEAIP